jgi:hypothetical protein
MRYILPMRPGRRRWLVGILAALAVAGYWLFLSTPAGSRDMRVFDPDVTAALEVDMWKAYYDKRNVDLFADLVFMSREKYRYTWAKSAQAGYHLARAAATFGSARDHYEQVLPDLESAYRIARDWIGARCDPSAIARAELAWWVARRVPGQDSPEQVGGLIADLNAALYEVPRDRVLAASILRAQAGKLRDQGGQNADWNEVARLLHASYRALHAAVNAGR